MPVAVALLPFCLFFLWSLAVRGPRFAVGAAGLIGLVGPTWLVVSLGGLPFNVRTILAIAALLVVCSHPAVFFRTGLLPRGFMVCDYAFITLAVVQMIADWVNLSPVWLAPLRAYGEWLIPYFLGRFAVSELSDLRRLAPLAVFVAVVLAGQALFEAFTKWNLFELVVGERPVELSPRDLERWGIKRVYGPATHAIFFAALTLLMLPWCASKCLDTAAAGWVRTIASVAIVGSVIAVFLSGARMVMLCTLIVALLGLALYRPRTLGPAAGVVAVVCLLIAALSWQHLQQLMIRDSGEYREFKSRTVTIGGEELPYSGTMSRLYVFRLYGPAMRQAGLFGFGTERTTGFPVRVPLRPGDEAALGAVKTVENTYVLGVLKYGWLGLIAYCTAIASVIVCGVRAAWQIHGRAERLFCSMASATIIAIALLGLTVFMHYDFGFPTIWTCGILASLYGVVSSNRRIKEGEAGTSARELPAASEDSWDVMGVGRLLRA